MSTPIRIQRRRTKGFNLQSQSPDGRQVISVTRPGKWGNPFKCVGDQIFIYAGHRRKILDPWVFLCGGTPADAVQLFEWTFRGYMGLIERKYDCWMGDIEYHFLNSQENTDELTGKHLACFCPIGSPCHADTLLKLANQ